MTIIRNGQRTPAWERLRRLAKRQHDETLERSVLLLMDPTTALRARQR